MWKHRSRIISAALTYFLTNAICDFRNHTRKLCSREFYVDWPRVRVQRAACPVCLNVQCFLGWCAGSQWSFRNVRRVWEEVSGFHPNKETSQPVSFSPTHQQSVIKAPAAATSISFLNVVHFDTLSDGLTETVLNKSCFYSPARRLSSQGCWCSQSVSPLLSARRNILDTTQVRAATSCCDPH